MSQRIKSVQKKVDNYFTTKKLMNSPGDEVLYLCTDLNLS